MTTELRKSINRNSHFTLAQKRIIKDLEAAGAANAVTNTSNTADIATNTSDISTNTSDISDNADAIALLGAAQVRIVSGTTDTILAADSGGLIVYTGADAIAVTLPDGLDVNHDFSVIQVGAGVPTVTPSGSDTTNGAQDGLAPSAQYKAAYFCKYDTGVWVALV